MKSPGTMWGGRLLRRAPGIELTVLFPIVLVFFIQVDGHGVPPVEDAEAKSNNPKDHDEVAIHRS
jgi:hypothetical protein